MNNLIERLRKTYPQDSIKLEAADRIEELEAQLKEVRRKSQWDAFNKVLFWVNEQEHKMIPKGDLYDAVVEMRPEE